MSSDSFGTFLETSHALERKGKAPPAAEEAEAPPAAEEAETSPPVEEAEALRAVVSLGRELKVLAALSRHDSGPVLLTDLQSEAGLAFWDFGLAVERLRKSKFITVTGNPGEEESKLTKQGARVAEFLKGL